VSPAAPAAGRPAARRGAPSEAGGRPAGFAPLLAALFARLLAPRSAPGLAPLCAPFSAALFASLAAVLLCACTTVPPATGAAGTLSGRLSVKVDGSDGTAPRSVSATFELEGDPNAGRLNLSTPLGSTLAQARWAPGVVALVTPQGERRYPDLDALTREVLGESLPVAALFDWLRGRPWAGAPSTSGVLAGPGFAQLGWVVDLARFDDEWVVATRTRAPTVVVRAKLDRP
jgi:outer membrane lipoprotein LolB